MRADQIPHIAAHYLREHGLEVQGWRFAWDSSKRRAGCCKYSRKLITLSRHYVDLNVTERLDDVVDTILHEIAHALTPGHGHDDVWKAKCVEIGARPVRCYDSNQVAMPRGRLVAVCGGCKKEFRRHKQCAPGRWRCCLKCGKDVGRLTFRDERLVGLMEAVKSNLPVVAVSPKDDTPPQPRKLR